MISRGSTGDRPSRYEFRISGRLDPRWEGWFEGLTVRHEDDHTTTLSGCVTDQAALHGILGRLRDLGTTLLSMRAVDEDPTPPDPSPSG